MANFLCGLDRLGNLCKWHPDRQVSTMLSRCRPLDIFRQYILSPPNLRRASRPPRLSDVDETFVFLKKLWMTSLMIGSSILYSPWSLNAKNAFFVEMYGTLPSKKHFLSSSKRAQHNANFSECCVVIWELKSVVRKRGLNVWTVFKFQLVLDGFVDFFCPDTLGRNRQLMPFTFPFDVCVAIGKPYWSF